MIEKLTDDSKIDNMLRFLTTAPNGAIVEVGVYKGGSLLLLASANPNRQCYGYDTFDGMPEEGRLDNHHKKGDFTCSLEEVKTNLAHLANVELVKGRYPESDINRPYPIALAHVDVDLYKSTLDAFRHLTPLMAKGGRIYCDDAFQPTCEGATLALCRYCVENGRVPHVDGNSYFVQF